MTDEPWGQPGIYHSQQRYIEQMRDLTIDDVETAADAAEVSAILGEMMWVSTRTRWTISWACSRFISVNRRYKFDASQVRLEDVELDKSLNSRDLVRAIKKRVRGLKATSQYPLRFQKLEGPCIALCYVD